MKIEQIEDLKKDFETAVKILLGDKLKKVILYGSYARGNYEKDSDVDFASIADASLAEFGKYDNALGTITFELSMKYDVIISIIIISEENFNGYRDILPFYSNLLKEGKVI